MIHLADLVPDGANAIAKETGIVMRAAGEEALIERGFCPGCAKLVVSAAIQLMLAEDTVAGVRWLSEH